MLAVVVFHAFPSLLPGGFSGVDVFFVISGYLISAIVFNGLSKGTFSFRDFYARRIRRIFPALLLVIATSLAVGWSVLLPDEYAQLAKHALAGLGFVANFVFWDEAGYFDTDAAFKPLLHLWSLGIEEQFYAVWPLLVVLAWRFRKGLWILVGGLAVASFLLNVLFAQSAPSASYFLPSGRVWELLLGAALALYSHDRRQVPAFFSPRVADGAGVIGLALVVLGFVLIDESVVFPGWWALLPTVGAALLIGSGPASFVNRRVLARPLMVWVGLVSFPLYLWHWPLLSFVRIAANGQANPLTEIAAVVAAFVLAGLTYRRFELPFRASGKRRTAVGLVLVSLICGAIGANIFMRDGLGFRLKDAQAENQAKELEWPESLRFDDRCAQSLPEVSGPCLLVEPTSPPAVAIIGDSHANHYFWSLRKPLEALGANLVQVGRGGCLPLQGLDIRKDGKLLECPKVVDAALDYLVDTPEVHTVFLAGRWASYLTGRELKDPVDHVEDDEELVLSGVFADSAEERQALAEKALDDTLNKLLSAGKHVVFLHAVPELDFDARESVAWNPNRFVNRVPRSSCEVNKERITVRNTEFRPVIEAVLSRYPQVTVLDPVPLMCDERACFAKRDGVLLYRDDDHLSLSGAGWLGEALRGELATILATTVARATGGDTFD